MSWDKVKQLVGTAAPALGAIFGGPLGGAAGQMIASALNVKNDPEAVIKALGTPEGLIKLKELELAQEKANLEYNVTMAKVDADDRNSARQREINVKDKMPAVLAVFITCGFFGVLAYILVHGIPETQTEVLWFMLGSLSSAWTGVIAYYFGSSSGSKQKTDAIAYMAKR